MWELKNIYYRKVFKAFELYEASLKHLEKIEISKLKTALELEPLDAFNSRFERLIDIVLQKLSKTIELEETWINEWTLRDRLNLLEKKWYIRNVDLWLEMRWARNKLAHEYIEDAIEDLYHIIINNYNDEITYFINKIKWKKQ